MINNAKAAFASGVKGAKDLANKAGAAISNAASNVVAGAGALANKVGGAISGAASSVANAAGAAANKAGAAISGAIGGVGEWLAGDCVENKDSVYAEDPKAANATMPWVAMG